MNTQTLNDKELVQQETVYEYLLRTYDVKDDLTRCTLWELVKDSLFDNLIEEKGLLPFQVCYDSLRASVEAFSV